MEDYYADHLDEDYDNDGSSQGDEADDEQPPESKKEGDISHGSSLKINLPEPPEDFEKELF